MWRLSDEQRAFREHLRGVVLDEIRPRVREIDERCDYPHDIHQTLAREGFFALAVPVEDGGRGETEVSFCAFVEELAKVSGTVKFQKRGAEQRMYVHVFPETAAAEAH